MVFLTDRKLLAKGSLPDTTPLVFITAGNFRREISRLRFAALEMTELRGSIGIHGGWKLFAKGFLPDTTSLVFITAGNFRWEISRLRFAALEMTERRGSVGIHHGRKLFANGFLLR